MIILASSSPRRRELLSMIGLDYRIETSGEEEMQPHGLPPAEFVQTLALQKAVPDGRRIVTESGILARQDVQTMRQAGVHAFLVGEAFMRAPEPGLELAQLFG